MKGARRKEQVLMVAVEVSKTVGYKNVTREQIADKAGISKGLITNYYSMDQLRVAIMKYAVKNSIAEIVSQGIANQDRRALKAPQELKDQAVQLLIV